MKIGTGQREKGLVSMTETKEDEVEAIEVTPEMIEAGKPHLSRYHYDHGDPPEDIVSAIFRSMVSAYVNGSPERARRFRARLRDAPGYS